MVKINYNNKDTILADIPSSISLEDQLKETIL